MVVARYGGEGWWDTPWGKRLPITVYPWMALASIEERIARRPNAKDLRPCMALSGETEHPHHLDILITDLDYTPEKDRDGVGLAFRDFLAAILKGSGAPVFSSTSGNGWHAILRINAEFIRLAREHGTEVRCPKNRDEKIGDSAAAEVFPAGARRHVVLRFSNPLSNTEDGLPIPRVSKHWLARVLDSARRNAETEEVPPPPHVNGDASSPVPERPKTAWVIGRRGEYYGPDPEPPDDWMHHAF